MLKRHYSKQERRALNTIWNAAGSYDFDPPFMAFLPDGSADTYMNMIIGFVAKWLEEDKVEAFFDRLSGSVRVEEFDDLLWLALENVVYEKEVKERPILKSLREERAQLFDSSQGRLSRQQMMLQSMLTLDQRKIRFGRVLGKPVHGVSARELHMADALEVSGDLDTDEVLQAMQDFLLRYFHYNAENTGVQGLRQLPGTKVPTLLKALLHHEHQQVDRLIVRTGTGQGSRDNDRNFMQLPGRTVTKEQAEKDLAYIQENFGRNILGEEHTGRLEQQLCTGIDAGCRLWVTGIKKDELHDGVRCSRDEALNDESSQDVLKQEHKNREYFLAHRRLIEDNVRSLSAKMDTLFTAFAKPLPDKSHRGRLDSRKAYTLAVLKDNRVFLHPGEPAEYALQVEVLLDGSASRQNSQEMIASQAYVLAESLKRCHIPCQIDAFQSLRGYTILRHLKTCREECSDGVFSYFAAGWNRDTLALKTAAALMEDNGKGTNTKRILIILTDANPADSWPIYEEGHVFTRPYEGDEAVTGTKEVVESLRNDGCLVLALYMGPTTHVESLHRIYGKEHVRIRSIQQLAAGVEELLQTALIEMKNRG